MGYTHYWNREREIDQRDFVNIVDDFKKILPKIQDAGVILADGHGQGQPVINYDRIWFNGASKCGHPKNEAITIPWPTKNAGGVANPFIEDAQKGNWFAGAEIEKRVCDGDCSYETFLFDRMLNLSDYSEPENGRYFDCTKTAFRPYDLAVIIFLIIAKHYLKEKIKISSDGEDCHWFDGKILCQMELGYGLNFVMNEELRENDIEMKNKS